MNNSKLPSRGPRHLNGAGALALQARDLAPVKRTEAEVQHAMAVHDLMTLRDRCKAAELRCGKVAAVVVAFRSQMEVSGIDELTKKLCAQIFDTIDGVLK